MFRRFRIGMRLVTVWTAMLALSVLPFVHAHAGDAWSHTGDHIHPPVLHSVFASDEAAHPPKEPQLPASGVAFVIVSHDLGHEVVSVSGPGPTPVPTIVGVVSPAGVLPGVSSTRQPSPSGASPSGRVLDVSTASRAPPFLSLS
jgi:hypothetical protein